MAKPLKAELAGAGLGNGAEITLSVGLDKNDVVAIAVSRVEETLINLEKEATALVEDLGKQIKKADTAFIAIRDEIVKDEELEKIAKATATAFGSKQRLGINIWQDREDDDKDIKVTYGFANMSIERTFKPTKELKKARQAINDLKNEQTAAINKAVEARRGLARIPTLERRVKAELASKKLSESSEGRKFLESLNDTSKSLKLLGVTID